MTDTGWTFGGFRVIESEYAPDPNGIKHPGTSPSDYSPFLSRIVNTCDLHGAILDVADPVQNMRAAYDYHTRRSVNTSKERTMTTDHIDQLAQWYADAEQVTKTNLPNVGDVLIFPNSNSGGYTIEPNTGEWAPNIVGRHETVRILARAPKSKPAWHDAVAVIARVDDGSQTPDTSRVALLRDVNEPGQWVRGYCDNVYSDELFDVTPLIEAKVTREMVERGAQASTPAGVRYLRPYEVREVLNAALGIEAE